MFNLVVCVRMGEAPDRQKRRWVF